MGSGKCVLSGEESVLAFQYISAISVLNLMY